MNSKTIVLPDGFEIHAELKVTAEEMAQGMMYRDHINERSGMLFVHSEPGFHPYWMANCLIPLDIVWIDPARRVVEISASTPPCPGGGASCPTYGGHVQSQYVLELGGGEAAKHRVVTGSILNF